jgi:type VI secretion system protein ImpF
MSQEHLGQPFWHLPQAIRAVTRDLEALLNTRQETLEELSAAFPELRHSLLTYGLPDFTALSLHSPPDCHRLHQALEWTIHTFEPRLERVRVTLEPPQHHAQVLRFRIEALLRVEPAPEPITLHAMLLHTHEYVVQRHA